MRRDLSRFAAFALASCLIVPAAKAQVAIPDITTKMTDVADDLAKTETGKPVQEREQEIVSDLDELIASLEKECSACRNGIKKNNPSKPMEDSMIRSGTGGIGDLVDPAQGNKDWSKLSNRERDRILQSMSEGFPPEYRTVLERYYRRLAEEKAAGTTPAAATKPAPAAPAKPAKK